MYRKRTWTIKQLRIAVQDSISYRQVLIRLNLRATGGNYDQLKKYIRQFNIDTKHFTGQGWNKNGRSFTKAIALTKILTENSLYQSHKLKLRLFAEGLKEKFCERCNWAERTEDGYLPLELDHINGDRHDNRLKNLRILCPNCHSLTPTYRGKNKRKPGWRNW